MVNHHQTTMWDDIFSSAKHLRNWDILFGTGICLVGVFFYVLYHGNGIIFVGTFSKHLKRLSQIQVLRGNKNMLHVWYIYLQIWLIFMVNVGYGPLPVTVVNEGLVRRM